MDLQEFVTDARKCAVDYFAAVEIMAWGDEEMHISLVRLEFALRIIPIQNPVDPNSPPILYLDLVYAGRDAIKTPEAAGSNILARVATVNPWEDGITAALDDLLRDAEAVLLDNPPPYIDDRDSLPDDRGGSGEDWRE